MGDPRKFSNKYSKPKKMLDKARIAEESGLKRAYGLKNMRELWIGVAELKKARHEARRLLSLGEAQRKKEEGVVLTKLRRLGIIDATSKVDDILALTVKDVLERRLQTRVVRAGLAKSMAQARQFITHGFIAIGNRMVNVPSYTVTKEQEATIRHYKKIEIEHNFVAPAAAPAGAGAPAAAAAEQKPEQKAVQ